MIKKITIPAALVGGFSTGFLIGIEIKSGQDISREGITWSILSAICSVKDVSVGNLVCSNITLYGIVLFLIGLIGVFEDLTLGPFLFIIGLFLGILLVMSV